MDCICAICGRQRKSDEVYAAAVGFTCTDVVACFAYRRFIDGPAMAKPIEPKPERTISFDWDGRAKMADPQLGISIEFVRRFKPERMYHDPALEMTNDGRPWPDMAPWELRKAPAWVRWLFDTAPATEEEADRLDRLRIVPTAARTLEAWYLK